MLNLWKKLQEKGRISSPKKSIDVAAFGPQYDGPLRFFDYNRSADIVPLEKGRLTLNHFSDIYENRSAFDYFKSFLESKMASEVLQLYDSIVREERQHNSVSDKEPDEDRSQSDTTENGHGSAIGSPTLHSLLLKLPEEIQTKLTQTGKSNENSSNNVDMAVFKSVLYDVLLDYWNEFIHSEWYFRYQVDLLTSRSVTLGDIMCHETTLSYFMQFLEMEGCLNVIEFWLAATNFKQFVENCVKNDQMDVNQILNDAINIYEKYLSLLATCPLGFDNTVRCAVEEAICDERNGLPQADSFELAVNTVLAFLRKTYLIPFLSSQHYVHMLSDLIRNSSIVYNHSPTSSVSECSTDSKKTLLTKFDPDTMWLRRKRSGLSFGRVDQLGRFQSDIEPDPDRINESKISKIMKKWVQRRANRVEEEMAWQVAEMVVKDITDLTMGSHLDDFEAENCTGKVK